MSARQVTRSVVALHSIGSCVCEQLPCYTCRICGGCLRLFVLETASCVPSLLFVACTLVARREPCTGAARIQTETPKR